MTGPAFIHGDDVSGKTLGGSPAFLDGKPIRAAIFDMDGTILDSMEVWCKAGENYLLALGMRPSPELSALLCGAEPYEAAKLCRESFGLSQSEEAIVEDFRRAIRSRYLETGFPEKTGVSPFLAALRARGVPCCIATATDIDCTRSALSRAGLSGFFDRIFTCQQFDTSKTEPKIFDEACAFTGAPKEETWVFEDALYAARTARDAGYRLAGVWDRWERETAKIERISDFYIRDYARALSYLT